MANDLVPPDPIKHVVVLILENHSFDQMLGALKAVYPDLEGIDPAHPGRNEDDAGAVYHQLPTTERQMLLDPHHEVAHVAVQLENNNGGFVKDFARAFPASTPQDRQFIMGYYPLDFLPALHALAREYTICDHWFSSLPGPTWPNRNFATTGTSNGRVNMPDDGTHTLDLKGWFEQDQETLFDRLSQKAIHWKVYFHDIPQTSLLLHQRRPENAARYFYINRFHEDARGLADDFPQFAFIEPRFSAADENDDHPPHDVMKAEQLIADVYNSLRANADLWHSTLLVVFYDEHGGFYDHIPPPPATVPDLHQEEYTFDRLGVRVPALLISPWVKQTVEHTQFDHTSVLQYLINKWGLDPLGNRAAAATSIDVALDLNSPPRNNTLERITLCDDQLRPPNPDLEEKAEAQASGHHVSLAFLAVYLKYGALVGLPIVYTSMARLLEAARGFFDGFLRRRLTGKAPMSPSAMEPDKIARRPPILQNDFASFLRRQKERAVPILANTIRNGPTQVARDHAVRALASLTGRKFHREPEKTAKASAWLQRQGK